MNKQGIRAETSFIFDYTTYDLKKTVEVIEQVNALLLKVDLSLTSKGILARKQKTMLPGVASKPNG